MKKKINIGASTVAAVLAILLLVVQTFGYLMSQDCIDLINQAQSSGTEFTQDGFIQIPNNVAQVVFKQFASALRATGTGPAKEGFTTYKWDGHCSKQIAQYSQRLANSMVESPHDLSSLFSFWATIGFVVSTLILILNNLQWPGGNQQAEQPA